MKHWFKDQQLRSLLKNTSYLGASRIVAALCGIATLALAGRSLGVLLLGTLILITSYAKAISGIAKFQSWQLIVRYGGHGVAHGDPEHFKVATGFAFSLDLVSGIAGMLIAVALLPFVGKWAGIEPQYLWLGMFYCTLLPTMGSATPSGVLRVLDRFDLLGWSDTLMPISRAILAAVAYAAGGACSAYVVIWYVSDLAGNLFGWFLAWRELKRTGHLEGMRPTLKPDPCPAPGASRLTSTSPPASRRFGARLAGSSSAACSAPPARLFSASRQPSLMRRRSRRICLAGAFYPEIMRMDLSSNKPWKLMRRVVVLASGTAAIAIGLLLLGGKPLLSLLFGKSFLGAYAPLVLLMVIPFLGIFSFPLSPMLYALGRSDAPLKAKIIATAVFLGSIAPLCWTFGVMGAALALVLGNSANVATMMLQLRGERRRVRAR